VLSGSDINVDWSPDGSWIAFEVDAQIYKARVAEGKVDITSIIQLTPEGRNFFPAWSSDGQWIVYDRSVADASGPSGIWIMRADGSQKERVFGGSFPDWHPRTRSLIGVIGSGPTSIWTRFVRFYPFDPIPPETLAVVVGANNQFPKYSPDGSVLAFESNVQVWLMDASGGNLKQLTFGTVGRMPDWSMDGQQLVYVGPQHVLWVMDANGSNQRQLTFRPGRR
jgi:Tol biopolymer transport system component